MLALLGNYSRFIPELKWRFWFVKEEVLKKMLYTVGSHLRLNHFKWNIELYWSTMAQVLTIFPAIRWSVMVRSENFKLTGCREKIELKIKTFSIQLCQKGATRMGFEPTRAEHIGLAVQRLNHSATSSHEEWIFDDVNLVIYQVRFIAVWKSLVNRTSWLQVDDKSSNSIKFSQFTALMFNRD